jgi:hypothetical protein
MPITQEGTMVPFSLGAGQSSFQDLTNPLSFISGYSDSAVATNAGVASTNSVATPKMSTVWYLFAIGLTLVVLNFAVERQNSPSQFHLIHIGLWNWIVVTLMVVLGLVTVKTLLNKYQVPGLTDLVNAV